MFWQAEASIAQVVWPRAKPADALLATAVAGEFDGPWLWAKKKKRKPAAAPAKPPAKSPAKRKVRHKQIPGEPRKQKKQSLSKRAEKYFDGWSRKISGESFSRNDWARLAILAAGLLVVLFYAFSAGGYFPIRRSYGELWVLYLIVLGLLFNWQVSGRMSRLGIAEVGVFSAYSLWILLSVTWSYIPADSYAEFLRAILYLSGFMLFYLYMARREWLTLIGHIFVTIVAIVAFSSLIGKIFPDQKPYDFDARLSNPITYWNTMALFAMMAFPIGLRVLTEKATNIITRCLYAPALYLFLIVMYFTFSRASYPLFVVVIAVYILLSVNRLRSLLQTGLSLFWAAVTIGICYLWLPGMIKLSPELDERVGQGHKLGLVLLLMFVLVVVTQIVLWRQEKRFVLTSQQAGKVGRVLAVAGLVALVLTGGLYIAKYGNPVSKISAQLESSEAKRIEAAQTAEERLFSLQSERFQEYRVSLDTFSAHPLTGIGAATWSVSWVQNRPGFTDSTGQIYDMPVKNGHSIFFDALAELGIVGAGLLVAFFVLFILIAVKDLRFLGHSRNREIYGAFFAASLALLIHAQFDWDWQMPVVFLSFAMFAGALLRFGMLSRAMAAGESAAQAGDENASQGFSLGKPTVLRWAAGGVCLGAMVLVILFLFSQTRIESANEQTKAISAQSQQGNMTLGGKYADMGNTAKSASSYDVWKIETEPLVLQAIAAQGQGRADEAEALLLKARDIEPNNYKIYLNLSRLYMSSKNLDKAVESIRKARQLNPLESKEIGPQEEQVRAIGGILDYKYGPGGVPID
ncbi:MAG: O-antigen ligase family protein [Thermoleophilia bacterium]|jgi:O-antigen ligase